MSPCNLLCPQVPPSPFLAPRPAAPARLAPLRPAFLSSTPSVIVQAANSGLATRTFGCRPSLDYPPESSFPMEVTRLHPAHGPALIVYSHISS